MGEEEKFRLKRISSDNKIIQIPFLERGLNIYIYKIEGTILKV